jgi:restriction system protein
MGTSRRKSHWTEDLVLAHWWVSFALAVIAFAILPLVLPMPLSGLAMPIAFFFLCLGALSVLRSLKNGWMLDRQTSLQSILDLSSKQFEYLLGEAYRRQGFKVKETLGGGPDGGVDLVLNRNGETILVQCKRYRSQLVPVQTVRELYGILHDRGANAAKVVTTAGFTRDAKAFAHGKPIELVDGKELLRLIRNVQSPCNSIARRDVSHSRTPDCPRCGSTMVKRTAHRGIKAGEQFWGCLNFPKCHGTRATV